MQRFRGTLVGAIACATIALGFGGAADAQAFDFNNLRARFEERRAQIEDRLSDSGAGQNTNESEPTPQPDLSSQPAPNDTDEEAGQTSCGCSVRFGLSDPDIRWQGGQLQFVPRFDLKIRVRQEDNALPWNLALNYSGTADSTPFSGQQIYGGQCYDGRYEYTGLQGSPITMSDIVRSLFGTNADREVLVRMDATISGCDADDEHRQATIDIEEFGNLDVGRWRHAR